MRTTVNVDDDVAAAVDHLRREEGLGLSEAVNLLVRRGLAKLQQTPKPFRQRTYDLGARVDVSNIGGVMELLDAVEQ